MFKNLYNKIIDWAGRPNAPYYLASLSFCEAFFFPIPPEVILVPMSLAKPESAWRYSTITTLMSVLGGLLGYVIGMLFITELTPYLKYLGYAPQIAQATSWFNTWGFWVLFVAAFTPLPFKVFTIAAGAGSMPILPFVLGSLVGRGLRFYIEAGLIYWGGRRMELWIRKSIDWLGWLMLVIVATVIIIYKWH